MMVGCRRAAEEGLRIGAVDRRCSLYRPCLGLPARRGSGVGWLRLHGVAMVSASPSKFSRRESGVRRRVSFPRWLAPDPPYIRQCLATPPAHVARSVTRPRVRRWACEFGPTAVPRNLSNKPAVGGTQGCFDCFAVQVVFARRRCRVVQSSVGASSDGCWTLGCPCPSGVNQPPGAVGVPHAISTLRTGDGEHLPSSTSGESQEHGRCSPSL